MLGRSFPFLLPQPCRAGVFWTFLFQPNINNAGPGHLIRKERSRTKALPPNNSMIEAAAGRSSPLSPWISNKSLILFSPPLTIFLPPFLSAIVMIIFGPFFCGASHVSTSIRTIISRKIQRGAVNLRSRCACSETTDHTSSKTGKRKRKRTEQPPRKQ